MGFRTKSDLRNHQAIIQPRLYDCLMVTQVTLLEKQQKSQSVVPQQPPRRDGAVQSTTELEVAEPELRQGALVEEAPAEPFEVMVAPATPESQLVCTLASKRQASKDFPREYTAAEAD